MQVAIGSLVEIPDELENFDVDENAKNYGNWYFNTHFDWLKGLSMRWANRHPQYTWEDCLRVTWERLPQILKKYNNQTLFDIKLWVRSQLNFYWFTACYRTDCISNIKLDKLIAFREHSADLVKGIEHKEFSALEEKDEHELYGANAAITSIEDVGLRNVIYAIVVLSITYREIAKLLGVSLGTVANMADEGFTLIYKANPKYYHDIYKSFRNVDSAKPSTITYNETIDSTEQESGRDELQKRITQYWQSCIPN